MAASDYLVPPAEGDVDFFALSFGILPERKKATVTLSERFSTKVVTQESLDLKTTSCFIWLRMAAQVIIQTSLTAVAFTVTRL